LLVFTQIAEYLLPAVAQINNWTNCQPKC